MDHEPKHYPPEGALSTLELNLLEARRQHLATLVPMVVTTEQSAFPEPPDPAEQRARAERRINEHNTQNPHNNHRLLKIAGALSTLTGIGLIVIGSGIIDRIQ